jgi:hypothetical protein
MALSRRVFLGRLSILGSALMVSGPALLAGYEGTRETQITPDYMASIKEIDKTMVTVNTFRIGIVFGSALPDNADITRYVGAKARVLRGGITWSSIDHGLTGILPTVNDGSGDLTVLHELDAYVQTCNSKNLHMLLQVAGGSGQGTMNSRTVNYSKIIIALAKRYKKGSAFGHVNVIECGNEPNFVLWDNTPNPEEYARLMSLIYDGVSTVVDHSKIMIGGLAGLADKGNTMGPGVNMPCAVWTRRAYAASPSIKNNYDIWNTHRYTFPITPTDALADPMRHPRGWPVATTGTGSPNTGSQQIRNANNDGTKPHACTEFGIQVANPPVGDPVMDAAAWVKIMDSAIVEYAKETTACYFTVFCDYDNRDNNGPYGIWYENKTPKPIIYPEFQRLINWSV